MDEIVELQRQLAEVQHESASHRLSERNCVELVMKLQSLKLVDLIFTRSGKEYLTHRKLFDEIEDEIVTRGGRVNIIDLPDALNVDLIHIEANLPAILEKRNGEAKLVRGEIITEYYLSSLTEEINDSLSASETGVDAVGAVATRYNLPVSVVADALTSRKGKEFTASLDVDSGTLRSAASLQRARSAARGALSGITCPSVIVDVAERLEIPTNIFLEVMENMLNKGEINGKVKGRGMRALFIPEVFSIAASQAAAADFLSAGFITLAQLQKLSIKNPDEFCTKADTNALLLSACVVRDALISTLRATITESNNHESWVDVRMAIPPDFPDEDVPALISIVAEQSDGMEKEELDPNSEKHGRKFRIAAEGLQQKDSGTVSAIPDSFTVTVFGNRFIFAPALLQTFRAVIIRNALEKATEYARELEKTIEGSDAALPSESTSEGPIEDTEKETGKKKKPRRRAGGKDKSTVFSSQTIVVNPQRCSPPLSILVPNEGEVQELLASDPEVQAVLQEDYVGNSGLEAEVLKALAEELYSEDELKDLYYAQAEGAVESLTKRQKKRQQLFEKTLSVSLDKIEFYDRTSDTFEDPKLVTASKRHIFKSLVYPTAVTIVNKVAESCGVVGVDVETVSEMVNAEKLKCLCDVQRQFPSNLGSAFKPLLASLSVKPSRGFSTFLSAYNGITEQLNLPKRRPLDKKKERSLSTAIRAELVEELNNKEGLTSRKAIEIVAVLLHAQSSNGAVVLVPANVIGKFCDALEVGTLPVEARSALRDLRLSLQGLLEGGENSNELSLPLSAKSRDKLLAIREFIS